MKYKVCDNTESPSFRFELIDASSFVEARNIFLKKYPEITQIFIYSYENDTMDHGFCETHELKDGLWFEYPKDAWSTLDDYGN